MRRGFPAICEKSQRVDIRSLVLAATGDLDGPTAAAAAAGAEAPGTPIAPPEPAATTADTLEIEAMPDDTTRVLDLGCGVGASLAYIAERRDIQGVGVTLSATQM